MIELPYLTPDSVFPAPQTALTDPDGLLAYGADLSINRLFDAYTSGIFPWFSEGEPILWWSPSTRAIIELDQFHISRSLRKLIRRDCYTVTMDHAFADVIKACATIPRLDLTGQQESGTWITQSMQHAYINLHQAGLAHSIEVWDAEQLVGGLYGVAVGKVFCGESMFHRQRDTSKLAMAALVNHMQTHQLAFIDCQMPTPHLQSLGAQAIGRREFIQRLSHNIQMLDEQGHLHANYQRVWHKQPLDFS